jgi:hypothetical protein
MIDPEFFKDDEPVPTKAFAAVLVWLLFLASALLVWWII